MSRQTRSASAYTSSFTPLQNYGSFSSRAQSSRAKSTRPSTSTSTRRGSVRPLTATSVSGIESQQVICAISESRGILPTVGLAFVNLSSGEAVLSQVCDSQTYVRTVHKLAVFEPSEILVMNTSVSPKSKLCAILEENLQGIPIQAANRRLWDEQAGYEYIERLAFSSEIEAMKVALQGCYFAVCSFAAALRHVETALMITFSHHTLRIKFEPSEGSVLIDIATMRALELIQNNQDSRSKCCLYGVLDKTRTPMGARLLRSNIMQPLCNESTLVARLDALEELVTKEDMFFAVRSSLKPFLDLDKLLTMLITVPLKASIQLSEQSINNIIMLKHVLACIEPVHGALERAECTLLVTIRSICHPLHYRQVIELINEIIDEDTVYQRSPLELRNQRCYAIKPGVNGLLDVARQAYKEVTADVLALGKTIAEDLNLLIDVKFDNTRGFYMRMHQNELAGKLIPPDFINVVRRKLHYEFQTLLMVQMNVKINDALLEVLLLSDKLISELTEKIRVEISGLFKICEAIAMLDMIASFGQMITTAPYVRPVFASTLAIKGARHPVKETILPSHSFIPNDIYATQNQRFQLVTGANNAGKSTYLTMVPLLSVIAQIGCFVPANFATFPMFSKIMAQVGSDNASTAFVSGFAAEMSRMAFILREVDASSLVIVDELGRATSSRDGLTIAVAIAEQLIVRKTTTFFATHHLPALPAVLSLRPGVVALHFESVAKDKRLAPRYKISAKVRNDSHYGIIAASSFLSEKHRMIVTAQAVSESLRNMKAFKAASSESVRTAAQRKYILELAQSLRDISEGQLDDQPLTQRLKALQTMFVEKMRGV